MAKDVSLELADVTSDVHWGVGNAISAAIRAIPTCLKEMPSGKEPCALGQGMDLIRTAIYANYDSKPAQV